MRRDNRATPKQWLRRTVVSAAASPSGIRSATTARITSRRLRSRPWGRRAASQSVAARPHSPASRQEGHPGRHRGSRPRTPAAPVSMPRTPPTHPSPATPTARIGPAVRAPRQAGADGAGSSHWPLSDARHLQSRCSRLIPGYLLCDRRRRIDLHGCDFLIGCHRNSRPVDVVSGLGTRSKPMRRAPSRSDLDDEISTAPARTHLVMRPRTRR
jgi:hypothetical protein